MNKDIIKILDSYNQVSAYLDDHTTSALLDKMKNQVVNKEFLLPFIGQFSAGKSKMINRLIGNEILPTKSIETTAFLTYIKYGEQRTAVLEYSDGTLKELDIRDVHTLDHQASLQSKPISALHITIPVEILKKGLTIVDTPGVNTLITEHVKMTEGLLFDSQYIIYVLGGAPSESDLEMLKRIEKLGISAIFIRTHIDLVKKGEEDVYKTIDEEQKIIVDTLGHPIIYIPLCNDETSSSYNEWSEQYDQFVSILTETINDDIEEVYLDRIIQRLELIQQDFVKVLEAKRELLVSSNGKNVSEIEEQIKKIDSSRATLKRQLDAKLEELNRESTLVEKRISRIIDASKNQAYANFCNQVCSMSKESFLDEVNSYYKKVLPEEIQRMSEETGEEIQKWTSGCVDNIQQKLQQLSSELSVIDVSFQSDFCLDIAREYAEKEQLLAEDIGMKLCQLEELNSKSEEELNSLGIERKQIENTLETYRSAIAEGESGLNAIRQAYEPQYIIKGGKLGGIMKHVGDVADIAMLLVPVAGWECAGAKLAAGAGKLSKGGKVAKQAAKALDLMSKGAKAMAEADKVLDASKIVKGGLQAIQQGRMQEYYQQVRNDAAKVKQARIATMREQEKSPNLFDFLSLSYWFQMIGDTIDPATREINMDYERMHQAEMRKLQQEQNELIRQRMSALKQQGQLINAQERILMEAHMRDEAKKEFERKANEARAKLENEKKTQIYNQLLENAKEQFHQKLENYSHVLLENAHEQIEGLAPIIIASATQYVESQLKSLGEQLDAIKTQKENGRESFEDAIADIDLKINQLAFE